MANQVITAMSHVESDTPGQDRPVEMEFTIQITPDGKLGSLTATDPEGNKYVVHVKLTSASGGLCCCPDENGHLFCFPLKPGVACSCDPK